MQVDMPMWTKKIPQGPISRLRATSGQGMLRKRQSVSSSHRDCPTLSGRAWTNVHMNILDSVGDICMCDYTYTHVYVTIINNEKIKNL